MRAVDEGVPQALSEWRPTIEGRSQGGHEWDNINEPIARDRESWPRSYGVAVRQPIFNNEKVLAAQLRPPATALRLILPFLASYVGGRDSARGFGARSAA